MRRSAVAFAVATTADGFINTYAAASVSRSSWQPCVRRVAVFGIILLIVFCGQLSPSLHSSACIGKHCSSFHSAPLPFASPPIFPSDGQMQAVIIEETDAAGRFYECEYREVPAACCCRIAIFGFVIGAQQHYLWTFRIPSAKC
jgi:hypothetical protein